MNDWRATQHQSQAVLECRSSGAQQIMVVPVLRSVLECVCESGVAGGQRSLGIKEVGKAAALKPGEKGQL
jgi:hypothetical protein